MGSPLRHIDRPARSRFAEAALVVVLFAAIMVVGAVQGTPTFAPAEQPVVSRPQPTHTGAVSTPGPTAPAVPVHDDPVIAAIVRAVVVALVAAVLAVAVVMLVRMLLRLWRVRPARRRAGVAVADGEVGGVAPGVVDAPAVRRGIVGALRRLDEPGPAGDAIVAAWIGLEESAVEAGLTRGDTETPAEFARRVIGARAECAADVQRLLGLYEQVRFGGLEATEHDRARARRALRRIQEVWR